MMTVVMPRGRSGPTGSAQEQPRAGPWKENLVDGNAWWRGASLRRFALRSDLRLVQEPGPRCSRLEGDQLVRVRVLSCRLHQGLLRPETQGQLAAGGSGWEGSLTSAQVRVGRLESSRLLQLPTSGL